MASVSEPRKFGDFGGGQGCIIMSYNFNVCWKILANTQNFTDTVCARDILLHNEGYFCLDRSI